MNTLLAPGDRIGGYVIEAPIGVGGMAEVHRARRPGGPAVALKLVTTMIDDAARVRFAREVASAARLDHPGCLRVLDHGLSTRGPYLVSELLGGDNLRQRLGRGRFAPRDAVRVADALLAALEHAHERGVVHRDVKPDNVVYRRRDDDRDLVLVDFGLARAVGDASVTRQGTCVGSPRYLAPERVLGRPADERADLYAVGAILFEMLTGRPPFVGATALEIARQQVERPLPELGGLRRGIAPQLAAVVRCALAKQPDHRFARAATMRAALEGLAAGGFTGRGRAQ
jgi:serine/threonine-protein kinase